MRRLTGSSLSISEIRDRLQKGEHVIVWDSHEYPLTMEREEHHASILNDVRSLLAKGYTLRISYSPSATDAWDEWCEADLEDIDEALKDEREDIRRISEEDWA